MASKLIKGERMEQVMLYGRSEISDQTISTEFNEQRQERPPTSGKFIVWCASFAPSCTSFSRTNFSNFIAITRKCKDFKIKL
jgi:hypothetical protein